MVKFHFPGEGVLQDQLLVTIEKAALLAPGPASQRTFKTKVMYQNFKDHGSVFNAAAAEFDRSSQHPPTRASKWSDQSRGSQIWA